MEKSTFIGLTAGIAAVLIGMVFKGVNLSALANPAAFFIIIMGTIAAVIIAFPGKDLAKVPKLFGVVFKGTKGMTSKQAIEKFVELSEIARKDGLLVLEGQVKEIDDPFLKRGIQMLIDGSPQDMIEATLREDIEAMKERHAGNASVFTQAGTYAPTLGVLGAVLGLIAALGNMNDTEALGHAISAAFIATLLGIFTGYVLWHPMANKLKRFSKYEETTKNIMLDGILCLSEGMNPRMVRDHLQSYLPTKERVDSTEEKK